MVFYITVLRALAACLITNAHYIGIYPTDLIANGGLIGDVLFFAVSGYCLYSIKAPFLKWYGKRIYRVYLPVVVITAVYIFTGAYSLSAHDAIWWFIYPTCYHFVASIIVLYMPYYCCMKIDWLKKHLLEVMCAVAAVWLTVYLTVYDKSYYHIDTVREPMIRFLFMESMLLGAWFRQNDECFRNVIKKWYPPTLVGMTIVYFVSKLLFSRRRSLAGLQILNQCVIFVLLFLIFAVFSGRDSKLEKMPGWLKKAVELISSITLEIYVVQSVLIDLIRPIGYFPLNWVVLSVAILICAFALNKVCAAISLAIGRIAQNCVWGGGKS